MCWFYGIKLVKKMKKNKYPTKENFFEQLNKILN